MKVKSSRGIVMKLICCTALLVFTSVLAISQALPKPTSGALLTITNGSSVNLKIYDSQIHTGTVRTVPLPGDLTFPGSTCGASDQIPTDAYVLQGGSPTGCDANDPFETASTQIGSATLSGGGYTFSITAAYCITGTPVAGEISCTTVGPGNGCNSAGTICANPDSGFLTVKNTSATAFVGTISLTGASSGCGAASDMTSNLGAGASVTLALGSPGLIDSSNCGGFNQAQHLTISNSGPSTASFGKDAYIITPSTASTGDTLDVLPIPVPAGPLVAGAFGSETPVASAPGSRFFATNFGGNLACIPYADFSAPNNPVCVELQLDPGGTDGVGGNYIYTAENDFNIDGRSLSGGVGGPSFLGQHNTGCPANGFTLNIFLSYTAGSPTIGDPLKGSGGGTGSCWVAAFDPNAVAVPVGKTVGFVGFQSPVVDTKINVVKAGSSVPLKWQQFNGQGDPEKFLSWCSATNQPTSSTCTLDDTVTVVPAPWVWLGSMTVGCPNDTANTATDNVLASGKSGFQANFPSDGFYQFNWQTVPKSTGCVAIVLQYDTGLQVFQAIFRYSKT